jgi:membrane carboxypeptidase/penicillin-binding protein PbpC
MQGPWESEIAALLTDLLGVQGELLAMLAKKRECLRTADAQGLAALAPEEQRLADALQAAVRRREALLRRAADEGLPNASIQALAGALPADERGRLRPELQHASGQAALLRHQSFVNWVIVQRTLLHLSQVLEIIATGGQLQPTYGRGGPVEATGALVDRAA